MKATTSSSTRELAGLAARYAFSLTENDLWTFLTVATIGNGHIHNGTSSEDGHLLVEHHGTVIAVVADGVSDKLAAKSGEGARYAVQLTAQAIARGLDAGLDVQQAIAEAFSYTHNVLTERTEAEKAFWGIYACTLATAVVQGTSITIGHIGDSSAYFYDGRRLTRAATAPVNDRPNVILQPTWRNEFTTQTINKPYVKAFALTTDGAESFFLGRSADDGSLTNPEVTKALHSISTDGSNHFAIANVINNLMQHTSYDRSDDRTMFWAFRKEKGA